jgi:hypothetical protein
LFKKQLELYLQAVLAIKIILGAFINTSLLDKERQFEDALLYV